MEDTIATDEILVIARRIAAMAAEKQADEIIILDMRERVPYCDFFIICSGRSRRQVRAISDTLHQGMKAEDVRAASVEGGESSRWILMDFGDIVVHIFDEKHRGFYDLETLWIDAPRVSLEAEEGADVEGAQVTPAAM
jgi:ribosome-associated protein